MKWTFNLSSSRSRHLNKERESLDQTLRITQLLMKAERRYLV